MTTANKTQWKIAVFIFVGFLVSLIVGTWSFISFERLVREQEQVTRVYATRLNHAETMRAAFEEKIANVRAYLIIGTQDALQPVVGAREKFLEQLAIVSSASTSPAHRASIDRIKKLEQDYDIKLWELLRNRATPRALAVRFETELRPKGLALKAEIDRFVATLDRELQLEQAQVSRDAAFNRTLIFVVAGFALLFGGILAYLLLRYTRALGRSENELRIALRDSEASQVRFLDLVNHLNHSVIWEADCEPFKFNFVSERLQFLLGVPPKEFVESSDLYFRYTHPDDREALRTMLKNAFETHTDQRVDHRMLTVDGNEIWVHSGVHVRNNPKGVDQFYGMTVDITPTKRKEEALKKSEEELQRSTEKLLLITDAQPALISFIGHDYVYQFANAAYSRWFKKSKDQIVGKRLVDIIGEQGFATIKPLIDEALAGRATSTTLELPYSDKSRFVEATYAPEFDRSGEVLGVYVSIHDMSEMKKLEAQAQTTESRLREYLDSLSQTTERLSLALDAAQIGVWELNIKSGQIVWSKELAAMFGFEQSIVEVTWDQAAERVYERDRELHRRAYEHALRDKRYRVEFRVVWPDGSIHWLYGSGVVHDDEQGQPERLVGVNIDITERKEHELQLQQEKETRERFVSLIIHDLRTPLSAAKMAAQLMVRKKDDPETTTLLIGRVVENANRMEAMIRDLLDTNKIKAGKRLTVSVGQCDLKDIVSKTVDDLTLIHGDRFNLIAPSEAPGVWDCGGLRRVTENLVTNAVKYGDPHEKITISIRQADQFSELSVHNVGEKLSEAELASLFDQFARTDSAERSGKAGWGIGLTLVKGIAEAHGGKVLVKSDSSGTTFTVWLPTNATAFAASDVSFGAPLEH